MNNSDLEEKKIGEWRLSLYLSLHGMEDELHKSKE